jgi:hypothetical protein
LIVSGIPHSFRSVLLWMVLSKTIHTSLESIILLYPLLQMGSCCSIRGIVGHLLLPLSCRISTCHHSHEPTLRISFVLVSYQAPLNPRT